MAVLPLFFVLLIPAALLIGAVILRTAVSWANRSIGRPVEPKEYVVEDEDDWGDYPLPGEKRGSEDVAEVIPPPGIGHGMGILFCILIVNGVITFALQTAVGGEPGRRRPRGFLEDADFLARLANLPIGFLIAAGLLAAMLPTTFVRGLLVTFFYIVICLGIAAVLFIPLFALRWGIG